MNFSWKQSAVLEVDFPSGDQLKLTIGTCTSKGMGRFQQALRERGAFLESKYGKDHMSRFGEDAEAETEILRTYERAVWFACLQSVEGKNSNGGFEPMDLPAEWKDIATYTDIVPPELSAKAAEIAMELNPGTFIKSDEDAEKNVGKLTVTRWMN